MDLWDVLKMVVRRWYVTVPIAVLGVSVALAGVNVGAEYTVDGSMLLVTAPVENDGSTLGLPGEGVAAYEPAAVAAVVMNSDARRTQLAGAGLLPSYEFRTVDEQWVLVSVSGDSADQTAETAQTVTRLYSEELMQQQLRFDPSPAAITSAQTIEVGDVQAGSSARRRTQGILLFVTAMAVLVSAYLAEALANRRHGGPAARAVGDEANAEFIGPAALDAQVSSAPTPPLSNRELGSADDEMVRAAQ